MAYRCWTCGTTVTEWQYTCPVCRDMSALQTLRRTAETYINAEFRKTDTAGTGQQQGFKALQQVQQDGVALLTQSRSEGISAMASAIEWGFGELEWRLQQHTDVLQSIDHTLKTPSQTQANEWRSMAEELRRRGVLDESEEFYLKALDLNRLDYRIYIGLAETYLQSNQFEQAQLYLEKSLPHAPVRQSMNYKSYSYRLIGHILACREEYQGALHALHSSIKLSPYYTDGYYDSAQYTALLGQNEESLALLQHAIKKSLYFLLAQKEQNFESIRGDVHSLLFRIGIGKTLSPSYYAGLLELSKYWAQCGNRQACLALLRHLITLEPGYFSTVRRETAFTPIRRSIEKLLEQLEEHARIRAEESLHEAEQECSELEKLLAELQKIAAPFGDADRLASTALHADAQQLMQQAHTLMDSYDYNKLLSIPSLAEQALNTIRQAQHEAEEEKTSYLEHPEEHRIAGGFWKFVVDFGTFLGDLLAWAIVLGLMGAGLGILIAFFIAIPWSIYFGIIGSGVIVGLWLGIREHGWRFREFLR